MSRAEFEARVIEFLDALCKRRKLAVTIAAETHLFDTKILDSVQFLELMNFLQGELAVEVPDRKLSMEFFATPRIIATNFAPVAP
jgi:acyl carrier protein